MAQKLAKHYDESISYFQKVLADDPKNTWSLYGIATNYADKKIRQMRCLTYGRRWRSIRSMSVPKPCSRIILHG